MLNCSFSLPALVCCDSMKLAGPQHEFFATVWQQFTHTICFPIRPMLHQRLNAHKAYSGSPSKPSNHTRGQFLHLPSYPLLRLQLQGSNFTHVICSFPIRPASFVVWRFGWAARIEFVWIQMLIKQWPTGKAHNVSEVLPYMLWEIYVQNLLCNF